MHPPSSHNHTDTDSQIQQREHADHHHFQQRRRGIADGQIVVVQGFAADCHGFALTDHRGQRVHGEVHVGAGRIGVVQIIQEARRREPDDFPALRVFDGHRKRKRAVNVAVFFVIRRQIVSRDLAERRIRSGQQLRHRKVYSDFCYQKSIWAILSGVLLEIAGWMV